VFVYVVVLEPLLDCATGSFENRAQRALADNFLNHTDRELKRKHKFVVFISLDEGSMNSPL
jgi:hypothetical protein